MIDKLSAEQQAAPKLQWTPTKEDLRRLYLDEKLSAAKIAKIYGKETGNRSGSELIRYYLKKHGIERRDRVEELLKRTDKIAAEWLAKNPKTEPVDMAIEEEAVLELLRNEGLSIGHLQPEVKERVQVVMKELHLRRGLSLNDVANLIGSKTSGYMSYLFKELGLKAKSFEESRLEAIHKGRKYLRKPFDGSDEDKAYMLGLKHGDLYAYRPFGDAVRVSTSTTHPALVDLFKLLFSPYGHVSKHPRYKEDQGTYEWSLEGTLDKSFGFLLEPREKCREWVLMMESTMLAYLAGLIDAEGNIRPYANPRTVGIILSIWNTDTNLLEYAFNCIKRLGYQPLEPYLNSPAGGESSSWHIAKKKAEWRLLLARFEEVQSLLRRLPLNHREKTAVREVTLSVSKGDPYEKIADKIALLKETFDDEVDRFTKEAELQYRLRHPGKDLGPNQAMKGLEHEDGSKMYLAMTDQLDGDGSNDEDRGRVPC